MKLKIFMNSIYFSIVVILINNSNKIPFLEDLANIESGSFGDVLSNYLYSIVGFSLIILVAFKLIINAKNYRTNDCGALNPFC